LSLLVEDNELVEKSLTFSWPWGYDLIEEENKKGKSISFKYWEKGGLEVGMPFFGTYLVRKMYTLDVCKQTIAGLVLQGWQDKLVNDIAFPMVDIKKISLKDGFSTDKKENPFMKDLMHDMVIHSLTKNRDKIKKKRSLV
jgi:hypothetical protein